MNIVKSRWIFLPLLIFILGNLTYASDDDFTETHDNLAEKIPKGLTLTLSLSKETFSQGETIPVTFTFRNSSQVKYYVWTGTYDRSGRIQDVHFFVDDPTGKAVVDPLATYFSTGIHFGGGLGHEKELGEHSQVFEMNEWVRFDKPGRYRFYATSFRVRAPDESTVKRINLVSPIIEVEIIPYNEKLSLKLLQEGLLFLNSNDCKTRSKGARILRFLDTPESIRAMVPLLGHPSGEMSWNARFGLISYRDWNFVKEELLEGLSDPQICVDAAYLFTLVHVSIPKEEHLIKWDSKRSYQELIKPLNDKKQQFEQKYLEILKHNIAQKQGRALAVSCALLLDQKVEFPSARATMARSFPFASPHNKKTWLNYHWDNMKCPEFVPVLEKILKKDFKSEQWIGEEIHSIALKRYLELKPENARKLILQDISRSHPKYARVALFSLPDESLPELDATFVEHLNTEYDLFKIAPLIERYATDKIKDKVISFYLKREGRWACSIQTSFLRYWIKHDRKKGFEALERAVKLREHTGCYKFVIGDVLRKMYSRKGERLALRFLDDPDPEVSIHIVRLLAQQGSQKCIKPFLKKLKTRKTVMESQPLSPSFNWTVQIYREIAEQLITNTRWQLNEEQINELWECLWTNQQKDQFRRRYKISGSN